MEIITRVNWVDALVLILMFRISYIAFQDGLSHEIFPLAGNIVVIILSLYSYEKIGNYLYQNIIKLPLEVLNFLSYLMLVIGISFILKLLRSLLDSIIKVEWHPLLENFGGLIFGAMRASIVTSLILMTLALMPLPYLQRSIRDKSLVGMHFLRIGPTIYEKASKFLPVVKRAEGEKGESPIDKEMLIADLARDKSIFPKTKKE